MCPVSTGGGGRSAIGEASRGRGGAAAPAQQRRLQAVLGGADRALPRAEPQGLECDQRPRDLSWGWV